MVVRRLVVALQARVRVEEKVELGRVRDELFCFGFCVLFCVLCFFGSEGAGSGERESGRERKGAGGTKRNQARPDDDALQQDKKNRTPTLNRPHLVDDGAGHDVAAAVRVAGVALHREDCFVFSWWGGVGVGAGGRGSLARVLRGQSRGRAGEGR